jgi:hypothetical protein
MFSPKGRNDIYEYTSEIIFDENRLNTTPQNTTLSSNGAKAYCIILESKRSLNAYLNIFIVNLKNDFLYTSF